MLLYIVGILFVAVGIAVSIALHEIGHLVPAKLFGVRVGQYMIGFGRTIFSFRRGETEYGVKALPLGGYISMAGMFPPVHAGEKARTASTGFFQTLVQDARSANADTIQDGDEDRTFYRLPIYQARHHHVRRPVHEPRHRGRAVRGGALRLRRATAQHHDRQRQRLPPARHQRAPKL